MRILRLRSSNIWLGVLVAINLSQSPVIVEVAGESRVGMSILWLRSSDIWLWVLLNLKMGINLSKSPVIVQMG